ncbi:unnamed protein product [Caenorhabditis bovis]|uniref:Major facilitator superfamily (MFS) profile domain-containing protein n=1 Tax=Caenorhabditis bovis TaxID=2654633 RepID=A0A8S1EJC1_9PELO|nr:unnamed protein product [Caenorhabditis bovis]
MLSNSVFNMFGAVAPKIEGCDGIIYNATTSQEECLYYDNDVECRDPMLKYEFKSVAVEFSQLCSRHENSFMDSISQIFGGSNLARFSTTSQMVGIMVGSALSGQLSDIYGRKMVTQVVLIFMLIFSTGSSFSTSIEIFILFRFLIGICCGGLSTVGQIFIVENLPSAHRMWMCTVVTWAPNYILFAFFAYIAQDWRSLARFGNCMTLVAIILCIGFLPESPKYLIQLRKRKHAIKAIHYINKFKSQRKKLSSEEIAEIVDSSIKESQIARQKAKKYHFKHLYTNSKIAIRTLVTSFSMFSVSYVTYGLLFNYDVLTGSIYINSAISGLLRYIVGALVALLDHFGRKTIGRKVMHFATVGLIMMCMLGIFFIEYHGMQQEYKFYIRALTLLAFGITGCLFLQILLITAELFPTGIRNIASAHVNVCGRLGNVFGPMIFSYKFGFEGAPYLVLGLLCLVDILVFHLFIPETKNQALPSEMPPKKRQQDEQGTELL